MPSGYCAGNFRLNDRAIPELILKSAEIQWASDSDEVKKSPLTSRYLTMLFSVRTITSSIRASFVCSCPGRSTALDLLWVVKFSFSSIIAWSGIVAVSLGT